MLCIFLLAYLGTNPQHTIPTRDATIHTYQWPMFYHDIVPKNMVPEFLLDAVVDH